LSEKNFYRFCRWTAIAIFLLFFLGGLVRSTGAGMGCPDWPKCFGQWIPPTSEDALPEDYESYFLSQRKDKVARLVTFLKNIGQEEKATEIAQATWLMEHDPYSFRKAYTEYINRVWGAFTGLLALGALVLSFQFVRRQPMITVLTVLGVLFTFFNAWLGSLVVDTNLFEGMVTIHFVFAFLAFSAFVTAYYYGKPTLRSGSNTKYLLTGSVLLFLASAQVIAGSQVRELVDVSARNGAAIGLDNYQSLGAIFNFHRVSSVIVLAAAGWLAFSYRRATGNSALFRSAAILVVVVLLQISTGASNITFGFPAFAQIGHITMGAAVFALSLYLFIQEFKIWRLRS